MKLLFFFSALLFVVGQSFTQSKHKNISFEEYEYDFEYIMEVDGEVAHTFQFVNKGTVPFSIVEVVSECGCTASEYTIDTLQPKDSGVVKVTFNPENLIANEFNKFLKVRVTNDTATLKIKGHVIPLDLPTSETMFTKRIGNTWFRSSYFQFGKMTNDKPFTKEFDFYNGGQDSIALSLVQSPEHLAVTIAPEVVAPSAIGKVTITYDTEKKNDYGYVIDSLFFKTGEDTLAVKNMVVSGNIAEYFPDDINLEEAPKVEFSSPTTVQLGTIVREKSKTATFKFTNTGKDTLMIRKISSPCTCVEAESVTGMEVKPGEEAEIKAVLSRGNRKKGNSSKPLYIYVNDPRNPIITFTLKAYFN